jgi:hypothetical protein
VKKATYKPEPSRSTLALAIRAAITRPPMPDGTTHDVFCIIALWAYAGILPKA